jgi:choline dehydrogenase-like flavoprotein
VTSNNYDVIIIGSGAGGGTLAYALASTGKKILILERGGYLPREKENWDPHAVFVENRYKTTEAWVDKDGKIFHPGTHYYVGGNTKVFGAALLRLRKEDFDEVKHHGGISPAWPVKYEQFKSYYRQAEVLYHVHGERGTDPTEPPEDFPYAFPPVSHEPRIDGIFQQIRKLGLRPFHLPLGIHLNEKAMEKSACIRCDTCDGFPCLVDAKSDAHISCINPALEHKNVTLLTHAKVLRLLTDHSGQRVTEVEVDLEGKKVNFSADIVVVSCGAINSAALLLRSANSKHPNGLANSSDAVGRHYMCHNNSAIVAISTHPNPTFFQKTIAINDFYFASKEWEFPMGHIQLLGKVKKDMLEGDAPMLTPGLALDYMATHSVGWWITSEDLPDPNNRVTIDAKGRIMLAKTPNNEEAHRRLLGKLKEILRAIECDLHIIPSEVYLAKQIPLGGVAHQVGTCRFGTDPKTAVLDVNCKAHDLDNLYVVDGSFFPSSSAVNPGLTIVANALRVGDVLKKRLSGVNG